MLSSQYGHEGYMSTLLNVYLTWNQSAIVAVQVRVFLWCVENGGVTVARDLLQRDKEEKKTTTLQNKFQENS